MHPKRKLHSTSYNIHYVNQTLWRDVEKPHGPWESPDPPLLAVSRPPHTFRQRRTRIDSHATAAAHVNRHARMESIPMLDPSGCGATASGASGRAATNAEKPRGLREASWLRGVGARKRPRIAFLPLEASRWPPGMAIVRPARFMEAVFHRVFRISRFGPRSADRGASAPGVSLRRCKNGGLFGEWT